MTGLQNTLSSSSSIQVRDIHPNNKEKDTASSPQQLLSNASSTSSTEPSAKSNPVSPADDDDDPSDSKSRSSHGNENDADVLNVDRSNIRAHLPNGGGNSEQYNGDTAILVDSDAKGVMCGPEKVSTRNEELCEVIESIFEKWDFCCVCAVLENEH